MENFLNFLTKAYKISGFDFRTYSIEKKGNVAKASSKFSIICFVIFFVIYSTFAIFVDFTADVRVLINSDLIHEIINVYSRNSLRIYIPIKIIHVLTGNMFNIIKELKVCCHFVSKFYNKDLNIHELINIK